MRITLLDSAYLIPDLARSLTESGFLVSPSVDGSLEVLTPWVPSAMDAAALVAARVNAWAALHGAEVALDPAPGRIAHPMPSRYEMQDGHSGSIHPTVSIGVPVYNGARFLEETLDSLLSQTFGDIEIIVCDNGSTDATANIAKAFASRDERVAFHGSDDNRGAAWNYNRALAFAQGRYFKWASHDDICAPTYIERCVEVLDRAPASVVLAYAKTVIIDAAGRPVSSYEDGLDLRQARPHERLGALIRNVVMSNAIFGVIRTDALRRTRGHGSYISADYVLLAELALAGQFWEVPEPLFFRREHPGTSRAANLTPAELADWFNPGSGDEHTTEFFRLFTEYLRAVRDADLTSLDRIAVYAATVPLWLRRFRGGMRRELLRETSSLLHVGGPERPADGRTHPTALPMAVRPAENAPLERVLVHDLIRHVIWQIAPDFVPQIRIHADPSLAIHGDAAGLEIILTNLISNAVRYGDFPVVVSAEAGDEFVITVDDSGRGVGAAFVPRLFEPFTRSEPSRSASEGAGLGLAIARMTAEASGGTLVYAPVDVGAQFRLVYPGSVSLTPEHRKPPATVGTLRASPASPATDSAARSLQRAA